MTGDLRGIGIVGAGTMGGGIAMAFANAGFPVTLVDASSAALQRGMDRIASLYAEGVKRGKVEAAEVDRRLECIVPATDVAAVASSALVVEAVFEDLALKSRLAGKLGQVCGPETILASNTSSLDIDILAAASSRPDRFVGMHFFSPAHIMKLVEVARGRQTSAATVEAVVATVSALGKTPVVCGVCFGFIGNRMAEPYLREAEAMVLEGVAPAEIDAVAQSPDWIGMAMGPCRMMDLAGLDVGASIIAERASATNLMDDAGYRAVVRALTAQGHLGQKTGQGFYRYEGRQAVDRPETAELARELARQHGIIQTAPLAPEEIFQRLFFPMVNEGFEVLGDGIAADAADIDTVFTAGYGFPLARGGPMRFAREIGLSRIQHRLEAFGKQRGNAYGYWTPSLALVQASRAAQAVR